MLDIAFDELTARSVQNMGTCELGLRRHERHHDLQLIAEAVGATCLIERRARPVAAGKRLVEQPAIQQDVHGGFWCLYLDRVENAVPKGEDLATYGAEIGGAIPRYQYAGLGG